MLLLFGKSVLSAIQFNIEFCLLTKEIEIVISQWMLPTEFIAAEPSSAQPAPH